MSSPSVGLGQSPSRNPIRCILALKYDIWWQQFSQAFPGSKVIFQDFPGPGIKKKIQDFRGGVGTLYIIAVCTTIIIIMSAAVNVPTVSSWWPISHPCVSVQPFSSPRQTRPCIVPPSVGAQCRRRAEPAPAHATPRAACHPRNLCATEDTATHNSNQTSTIRCQPQHDLPATATAV